MIRTDIFPIRCQDIFPVHASLCTQIKYSLKIKISRLIFLKDLHNTYSKCPENWYPTLQTVIRYLKVFFWKRTLMRKVSPWEVFVYTIFAVFSGGVPKRCDDNTQIFHEFELLCFCGRQANSFDGMSSAQYSKNFKISIRNFVKFA